MISVLSYDCTRTIVLILLWLTVQLWYLFLSVCGVHCIVPTITIMISRVESCDMYIVYCILHTIPSTWMEGTVLYTSSNNYIMDSDLLTTLHGKKEIFFPQNLLYVKWIFLYISVEPGNIILFCCTYIPNFVCYVLLVLKVRKTGIWFTFLIFFSFIKCQS